MPYFAHDGIAIAYEDIGRGPAILFSHGFLLDRSMYAAQIAELGKRYRCIAWDQRGFGATGPVDRPFSYGDSAKDALALLDHLGIEQAVLVGLSQGGFLSMRAALLAPDRIRGLVLISTKAGLDSAETIGNFRALQAEWPINGAANVGEGLADMLIGDAISAQAWREKWNNLSLSALEQPIETLVCRDDLTGEVAKIECPSIVIHGDKDLAINIADGEALSRALHALRFVRLSGAGHAPPITHAAQVTAAIEWFADHLPQHV